MMNNEIKMVALNDDALESVVGGFDVEPVVDIAKEEAKQSWQWFISGPTQLPGKIIDLIKTIFS